MNEARLRAASRNGVNGAPVVGDAAEPSSFSVVRSGRSGPRRAAETRGSLRAVVQARRAETGVLHPPRDIWVLVGRRFGANESGNVHHGASSAPFRVDPRPTSAGAEAIPILAHAHLTDRILHAFFAVYNELGPGFLESVYETAMAIVMRAEGLTVECQAPAAVYFRGQLAGEFRADLLVERLVVVELEAGRALESRHEAQLLDYLRATDVDVGLLLNFGPRPAFRRLVYSRARGTVEVRASAGTPSQSPRSASVCDEPA